MFINIYKNMGYGLNEIICIKIKEIFYKNMEGSQ